MNEIFNIEDKVPEKGTNIIGFEPNGDKHYCFRCNCSNPNCTEWRCSVTGYGLIINVFKFSHSTGPEFDVNTKWIYVNDDGLEPLDMENFEWLSINDDEIIIACGGDWQEPLTLTIKLINGKLTVTNSREGFANGMYYDTFLKNIS